MEMKLDPQKIRSLRLSRSWSQEKLADEARLNPRTIQRVETEGSASLHTRLRLATAFGLEPAELDVAEVAFPFHLPMLLLISLLYLASAPIFFSLSRFNLHRMGSMEPGFWPGQFELATLGFWLCVALPWMGFIYFRRRERLHLHMAWLGALAFFSVFRVMSEDLAASVLSVAVYFAGLALLYTCFRESRHRALVRRSVWIILATYLFVWLVQAPFTGYFFWGYIRWNQGLSVPAPWISFPGFIARMLAQTPQLFPLVLVLLYDLGRPGTGSLPVDRAGVRSWIKGIGVT